MVNPKRIIETARNWKKLSALGRRASSAQARAHHDSDACSTWVAEKGHFVVCSCDAKRFMVPLVYLQSVILLELLKMSEDEFGLSNDRPITLPCDAVFVEYVLSLLRRWGSKYMDKVLLDSVFKPPHSPCSSRPVGLSQQAMCSF